MIEIFVNIQLRILSSVCISTSLAIYWSTQIDNLLYTLVVREGGENVKWNILQSRQ